MKIRGFVCLLVVMMLFACGERETGINGLSRSRVDALNKQSFRLRTQDSKLSEQYGRMALKYISDSLPGYNDGKLRAWNNIANSYLHRAKHDSMMIYIDSVLSFKGKAANLEVEQTLAKLLEARLRQRKCDIAGSYQILYDVENSKILDRREQSMLYNLAKSEFYITTTTLNYHYRSKSQYQQAELLTKMEELRNELYCDYAEDMSFNYAIAYGYYALCSDTANQKEYLRKSLQYTYDNLQLLGDSLRFNTYELANNYQMLGFMLWSPNISSESWEYNEPLLEEIGLFVGDAFGFDVTQSDDPAFAFLSEATSLFFLHDDPYQRLGAVVAAGRYSMAHGDTVTARLYFNEALIDTTMLGVAPKFEAMLYEGFLTSGCAENTDEVAEWTRKELKILNEIKQNEKADFLLQLELSQIRRNNIVFQTFSLILILLVIALLVTLFLLRRRTKALQRETMRLQNAKQQDVERIANVETCLSVLRHDITPFVSYLQNENLPEDLRRDVTGQLLRTFENIKSWTNLSIPSGLQFRCGNVSLQQVFDGVAASVNNYKSDQVELRFDSTELTVKGDILLLEILLRNLVNNAIQHTEKGSVVVSANRDTEDGRFAIVSVRDTGEGMSQEELDNLFRADKKIKRQSHQNGYGTGFGLILCRYIIKKHDDNTQRGCRIWAESKEGEGSCFYFRIESL